MKILITGAAGFIGYHLTKELIKKNNVLGIDNFNNYYSPKYKKLRINLIKKKNFKFLKLDLRNKKKLALIFKKFKPNIVYHLASQPGIMYSFKNPETYVSNNIKVTKNLIEQSIIHNVDKFYFTSSSSVYGNKKKYPIDENSLLKPINTYAKTKKECEKILLEKFKDTNVDLKIFRPFTVYGPYARPDMIFIPYLKRAMNKENFYLFNKGEYVRDFTYVEDVVKILSKFLQVGIIDHKIFNICSSNPIKINNLVKIIDKYNLRKPKIIFKPYRKGEMKKTFGNNQLVKKIIKFKKFTNIDSGIKKTINWYSKFKNKDLLNFDKIK